MLKEFLETGEIVGTHGIKGEVRVHPWSDTPDFLCDFKILYLDGKGEKSLKVKTSRVHGNIVLIKFDGVDSIEAAEKLRGKVLYINRSNVRLKDGRSFIQDIIDCKAIDIDSGDELGTITDVMTGIANDVWTIARGDKEYLLPAIDDVVIKKEIEDGKIYIRPLKGIFDDEN